MESLSEVNLEDFRTALTAKNVRHIQFAHIFSVPLFIFFFFQVWLSYSSANPPKNPDEVIAFANKLSLMHIFIWIIALFLSKLLYDNKFTDSYLIKMVTRVIRTRTTRSGILQLTPVERSLRVIQMASQTPIFLFMGAAYFGLTITRHIIDKGALFIDNIYLCNLFSSIFLFLYIGLTFPTLERIENIFITKIQKKS